MATVPNDVDTIRRQMAEIRRELHEDVKGVAATAAAATDWHRYLTMYPWVTLGVAFGVGYYLVPKRHRTAEALATTQADLSKVRQMVESTGQKVTETLKSQGQDEPTKTREKGLIAAGLGMVAPLVLRAAQGYALKYLEHWIMQQQSAAHHAGPQSMSQPGPGRPSPGPRRSGGPGAV